MHENHDRITGPVELFGEALEKVFREEVMPRVADFYDQERLEKRKRKADAHRLKRQSGRARRKTRRKRQKTARRRQRG